MSSLVSTHRLVEALERAGGHAELGLLCEIADRGFRWPDRQLNKLLRTIIAFRAAWLQMGAMDPSGGICVFILKLTLGEVRLLSRLLVRTVVLHLRV
jgi:hypothetical protein